jgi:hypothetical protein
MTIKGYGVDIMLLYRFANLLCTGTAPGRYVKLLNELLKLKYHMDWVTNNSRTYSTLIAFMVKPHHPKRKVFVVQGTSQ